MQYVTEPGFGMVRQRGVFALDGVTGRAGDG
jgi:hypothetical protein